MHYIRFSRIISQKSSPDLFIKYSKSENMQKNVPKISRLKNNTSIKKTTFNFYSKHTGIWIFWRINSCEIYDSNTNRKFVRWLDM